MGQHGYGIDHQVVRSVAGEVRDAHALGAEIGGIDLAAMDGALAEQVGKEVERQLFALERRETARTAFEARGGAVVVDSLDEALALADEFAPEHLCLLVQDAPRWAAQVRNAGGVFVGESSPETLGDYTAGPSHVMPTSGTARFASPLGVHDFLKATSVVSMDEASLRALGPATARIARAEGLTAHVRTIELRLGDEAN